MSKKTRTKKKRNRELVSEKHAPERYVVPGPQEPIDPGLRSSAQATADRLKGLIQTSANYGDVKMLNRLAILANRILNEPMEEWEAGLYVELPLPHEEGEEEVMGRFLVCRTADLCLNGPLHAIAVDGHPEALDDDDDEGEEWKKGINESNPPPSAEA